MTGDIIFPFNIVPNISRGIFSICKNGLRIIKFVSSRRCFDTYKLFFCLIERILPFFGSNSYITISGGSVKAYSNRMSGINCTPHNDNSKDVYCCIIKNEHFLPVVIDSVSWNPSDHIFPDSTKDGNLYVWLTEKENNDAYNVTVGTEKWAAYNQLCQQ